MVCSKSITTEDVESQQIPSKESSVLCLAVVREDKSDVVVFDAKGVPKYFSYKDQKGGGGGGGKICFEGHGHNADDFLTPCFDEEGCHGEPEESCFCGNEEPHIHAHWHDPSICDVAGASEAADSHNVLMKLAKLTLEPTDNDGDESAPMLSLPVSDHMPNQCNANEIVSSLRDGGHGASGFENQTRRRMYKVQVRTNGCAQCSAKVVS